jgi:predicted PurR-regulated permease PerM
MSDNREDPKRRQRLAFLWISAIALVAILIVSNEVLLPFVLGLLVAYILLPLVLRIEKLRVPRFAAILLVYVVVLGAIGGFIAVIMPSMINEVRAFKSEVPHLIEQAETKWGPAIDERLASVMGQQAEEPEPPAEVDRPKSDAPLLITPREDGGFEVHVNERTQFRQVNEGTWRVEQVEREKATGSKALLRKALDRASQYVAENSVEIIKLGQKIVSAVSRGIFNLFMTLMLGGYMMLTHERILRFFRELFLRSSQDSFDRLLRRLDRGLSGVVRGQLLICLVNGVLSAIGFWLFDLKYWPLMALIAAIGSLIPIFGSIVSAFPAVAIGLTQSPGTAFAVLAWIIGIHQVEANFLNPKIIGDSAKIHPVLVVFSLLVGEHFFQIKGALFAVPCLSLLQTIFLHFRETTMGLKDPTATHSGNTIPPETRSEVIS